MNTQQKNPPMYSFRWLLPLLLGTVLTLGSCAEWNDNPGNTVRVSLYDIRNQMGFENTLSTLLNGPEDSAATTGVQALVIGAMKTDVAYTENDTITVALVDEIKAKAEASAQYFTIVHLAGSPDFVEFEVPPATAGTWQMVAIGTKSAITSLNQLTGGDEAVYVGMEFGTLRTSDNTANVDLTLQRACLLNSPPLGCAQITATAVPGFSANVTTGVEILSVDVWDSTGAGWLPLGSTSALDGQLSFLYPLKVRAGAAVSTSCGGATECEQSTIAGQLALSLATYFNGYNGATADVRVRTTHQLNPAATAACANQSTVGLLEVECSIETYYTTIVF